MTDALTQWKEFLNPETLRRRMLTASLFLVAHEMLVAAIKTRLRDFFIVGFDEKGLTYSPSYEVKVLSLDPKGKNDAWRASIVWLEQMSVIDHVDEAKIRECTNARNTFAHELSEIVSGRKNPDFEALFPVLVDLIVKIDKWWIVNVEIDTALALAEKEIDFDQVIHGSQLMLSIIHQTAVGDLAAAQGLYEAFISGINA